MAAFESLIATLSNLVWGVPTLIMLVVTGLFLSYRLRLLQFRALPLALRLIFKKEPHAKGDISHFAALATSLAATVGIGNIVGVATAITLGGPGAVFWMWAVGLLGMATKYSESLLAVHYREITPHGARGGPMYYLTYGAKLPWLGVAFAVFAAFAAFGIGNMVQSNSVAQLLQAKADIAPWLSGAVMMVLSGAVILGGIRSIGRFTSALVPFMIAAYLLSALAVIFTHPAEALDALGLIFRYAFEPIAAGGGFVGASVAAAIRYGVARGIFSNEAGMGSAAIAAAAAKTDEPVEQALVSMTQTFIDTLIVCTATALVILMAPQWGEGVSAAELTYQSFAHFLGGFGALVVTSATLLFAYSTLIGWSYFGEKAMEFLLGARSIFWYRLVFVIAIFIGAQLKLELAWNLSDLFNGLMILPNLIALLLLHKVVTEESQRYFQKRYM
ncbi:MAG: sodium:alanine symporter family protein [Campylobacterales bacterium]|nr:sodium:alanine symporter family protein [Campylobacterales bacterium]